MDFEDGTEILSKLGILHSTEECPKKETNKSAYVEVTSISSPKDAGEEVVHIPKLKSRFNLILFLFQFLSFFVTGFSFFDQQLQSSKFHRIVGSLAYIGGILAARKCTHFLRIGSFGLAASVVFLVISLGNLGITSVGLSVICFSIEILVCGILTYVSLALWFMYFRSHLVKIVCILLALYAGALSHAFLVKDIGEQLRSAPVIMDLPPANETSRKPEIAQGIASIETKTNENEIMREHLSGSSTIVSAGFTTPSAPISQELIFDSTVQFPITVPAFKVLLVGFIFISVLVLICCGKLANLPQQLSLLKDASGIAPSNGLRVRYAMYIFVLQVLLVVFVQQFASSNYHLLTVYSALTLGSLIPAVTSCCKWSYERISKCVMVAFIFAASYSLIFNSSGLGVFILFFFLGSQKAFALLHIEVAVKPRMSLSLDLFLIPCAFGSSAGWFLITLIGVSRFACALLAFAVAIIFLLLQRSILRKTRFDEILQYKSEFDNSGDYVALLEQDFSSDSESVSFEKI